MISHLSKDFDLGFIVLYTDKKLSGLKRTVDSIKKLYAGAAILCVVGNDVSKAELQEINTVCDTVKGKATITSLINVGLKKTKAEWNVIVFSGAWLQPNLLHKFDLFVRSPKDILFPVVNKKANFVDGSMNGIIINKMAIKEIGELPNDTITRPGWNDLELIKILWGTQAIQKGYKFKAIFGMKV